MSSYYFSRVSEWASLVNEVRFFILKRLTGSLFLLLELHRTTQTAAPQKNVGPWRYPPAQHWIYLPVFSSVEGMKTRLKHHNFAAWSYNAVYTWRSNSSEQRSFLWSNWNYTRSVNRQEKPSLCFNILRHLYSVLFLSVANFWTQILPSLLKKLTYQSYCHYLLFHLLNMWNPAGLVVRVTTTCCTTSLL